MQSISSIISNIKEKVSVPKGKHLEVVFPILSQTTIWNDRFPEEDKDLIEEIISSHAIIIVNSSYSIRICDNFYFVNNMEDYNQIYDSIMIKAISKKNITTNFRVSYRIIDEVEFNEKDITGETSQPDTPIQPPSSGNNCICDTLGDLRISNKINSKTGKHNVEIYFSK